MACGMVGPHERVAWALLGVVLVAHGAHLVTIAIDRVMGQCVLAHQGPEGVAQEELVAEAFPACLARLAQKVPDALPYAAHHA